MNTDSLRNALEAYVQEEIGARKRMIAILARQTQAVTRGKPSDLDAATRILERELALQIERSARRKKLLDAFAALWSVASDALSLSSIAERCGAGSERLLALRRDLRDATASLARENRRFAALVALHRRVVNELIGVLIGDDGAAPLSRAGTLVDAEG